MIYYIILIMIFNRDSTPRANKLLERIQKNSPPLVDTQPIPDLTQQIDHYLRLFTPHLPIRSYYGSDTIEFSQAKIRGVANGNSAHNQPAILDIGDERFFAKEGPGVLADVAITQHLEQLGVPAAFETVAVIQPVDFVTPNPIWITRENSRIEPLSEKSWGRLSLAELSDLACCGIAAILRLHTHSVIHRDAGKLGNFVTGLHESNPGNTLAVDLEFSQSFRDMDPSSPVVVKAIRSDMHNYISAVGRIIRQGRPTSHEDMTKIIKQMTDYYNDQSPTPAQLQFTNA